MEFYDFSFARLTVHDDLTPPILIAEVQASFYKPDINAANVVTIRVRIEFDAHATIQQIRERAIDEARATLAHASTLLAGSTASQLQARAAERRAASGQATIVIDD